MAVVLVADDDPDIRDLVVFKLERAGHQTVSVPDGLAALEAARNSSPDLAIIDVTMPGMDGLGVCAELRADLRTAHIPVILLTARAQGTDHQSGIEAGALEYVTKPFSPRELVDRVDRILSDRMRKP